MPGLRMSSTLTDCSCAVLPVASTLLEHVDLEVADAGCLGGFGNSETIPETGQIRSGSCATRELLHGAVAEELAVYPTAPTYMYSATRRTSRPGIDLASTA